VNNIVLKKLNKFVYTHFLVTKYLLNNLCKKSLKKEILSFLLFGTQVTQLYAYSEKWDPGNATTQ